MIISISEMKWKEVGYGRLGSVGTARYTGAVCLAATDHVVVREL